jgi:hypothetical protein
MNLTALLESVQDDLRGLGELGDDRARAVVERLAQTLGATLRLKLLDLLGEAAAELGGQLPAGHVEVRLAGQEPELVFVDAAAATQASGASEELSARISLRLPDSLKASVERAADRDGVSTNTWLVRAIARAAESRPVHAGGRRLTGYGQS